MDIFGSHHKIGPYLGVISTHFSEFLKVKLQNGGYFFFLGGGPEIPNIFGG